MRKIKNTGIDSFDTRLAALSEHPAIQRLKEYRQHRRTTTYDHVCHVALTAHRLSRRLHIRTDDSALLRGCLLHDYYLYDTRQLPEMGMSPYRHGTSHPAAALRNAQEIFTLSSKERNIIASHMWPFNPTTVPRSREAWMVTLADKFCALTEAVFGYSYAAPRA